MKNRILTLSLAIALSLSATACNQGGVGGTGLNKQQAGIGLGAIGGGLAGNQFGKGSGKTAATIGGAVLGGLVGNSVGSSLDKADSNYNNNAGYTGGPRQFVNNNVSNVLENTPTGNSSSWQEADGSRTTVTPTGTYANAGQDCRNYTQSNSYSGTVYGSACRQPNGIWR